MYGKVEVSNLVHESWNSYQSAVDRFISQLKLIWMFVNDRSFKFLLDQKILIFAARTRWRWTECRASDFYLRYCRGSNLSDGGMAMYEQWSALLRPAHQE